MASGHFLRSPERNLEPLHRRLAAFNRQRLAPSLDVVDWQQQLRQEMELRVVEGHFIEAERAQIREVAECAPTQPREFVRWFEGLKDLAARQSHPLLNWLATSASRSDMSWFLSQDLAGAADLEDLLALTQLKLPRRAQLELARNYWDEMGQGHAPATRQRLLEGLLHDLHVDATEPAVWESLARDNLMLGLAANRRYAFQSLGALGAMELFAPEGASLVNAGLERLGLGAEAGGYFAVRTKLSALRAHAWCEEVILPLVALNGSSAAAIAEGALLRLAADARCFQSYRRELRPNGLSARLAL